MKYYDEAVAWYVARVEPAKYEYLNLFFIKSFIFC